MIPPDCEAFRRDVFARALGPRDVDADNPDGRRPVGGEDAHARTCDQCANWLTRQRQVAGLVGQLDRFAAPEALDHAVAAEIAANQRRDRAFGSLEAVSAPRVLRRLVQEEIDAGASAVVARSLAGLERRSAPAELDQLVAERLATDLRTPTAVAEGREARPILVFDRNRKPWLARAATVAAAAVMVFALRPLLGPDDSARQRELPEPRVRLTMISSVDQLSPLAQSLAAGLSGGALTTDGRTAGEGPR